LHAKRQVDYLTGHNNSLIVPNQAGAVVMVRPRFSVAATTTVEEEEEENAQPGNRSSVRPPIIGRKYLA